MVLVPMPHALADPGTRAAPPRPARRRPDGRVRRPVDRRHRRDDRRRGCDPRAPAPRPRRHRCAPEAPARLPGHHRRPPRLPGRGRRSYYGPSVMSGFAENGGAPPYLVDSVRRTLFAGGADRARRAQPRRGGRPSASTGAIRPTSRSAGASSRRRAGARSAAPAACRAGSVGGCAEVLDWLRGTPWFPTAHGLRRRDPVLGYVRGGAAARRRHASPAHPGRAGRAGAAGGDRARALGRTAGRGAASASGTPRS